MRLKDWLAEIARKLSESLRPQPQPVPVPVRVRDRRQR